MYCCDLAQIREVGLDNFKIRIISNATTYYSFENHNLRTSINGTPKCIDPIPSHLEAMVLLQKLSNTGSSTVTSYEVLGTDNSFLTTSMLQPDANWVFVIVRHKVERLETPWTDDIGPMRFHVPQESLFDETCRHSEIRELARGVATTNYMKRKITLL